MKRTVCVLTATALALSLLTACRKEPSDPTTEPTETTCPVETTQPVEAPTVPVQVPESDPLISGPEKLVSVTDFNELTLAVKVTAGDTVRRVTYALRNDAGQITFYERNAEAEPDADQSYGYESVCFGGRMFTNGDITGEGFREIVTEPEYGSAEGYFRNALAMLGFDFGDWLRTDGFLKGEEATWLDRVCDVYETACTDLFGEGYKVRLLVDRETGLWVRSERTIPGTGETILMEVESMEASAHMIPGSRPVALRKQVIYREEGVTVTAMGLDFTDPNGAVLVLETENATDTDICATVPQLLINGLYCPVPVQILCAAGGSCETRVQIPNGVLDRSDIRILDGMDLSFSIEKTHGEADGTVVSDGFLVEDTGTLHIRTECPGDYVQAVDRQGQRLIGIEEVTVLAQSFRMEENGDGWFGVYCEALYARPVRVVLELSAVNGIPVSVTHEFTMGAMAEGFSGFRMDRQVLAAAGIRELREAQVSCAVFDGETRLVESSVITVTF